MPTFSYRHEVYRKLIHLSSLWMAAAIYFLAQNEALVLFAVAAVAVLSYEVIRRQDNAVARLLEKILGAALRPDEKGKKFKPSGAIYMLIAAFLSTLLFPNLIAITAMSMMLTGDAAAALVGKRFGRVKVLNKSIEGSAAFFVVALATAAIIAASVPVATGYMYAATIAAAAATTVELVSKKLYIDDNLSVPLAAGSVMMLLM